MVIIEEIEDRPWETLTAKEGRVKIFNTFPGIIHMFCKSKRFLTKLQLQNQETWKSLHPGWVYVLWTERDVVDYVKMNHPGSSVDGRFLILYDYGGVSCTDLRITPTRNLEEVMESSSNVIVDLSLSDKVVISTPKQELWKGVTRPFKTFMSKCKTTISMFPNGLFEGMNQFTIPKFEISRDVSKELLKPFESRDILVVIFIFLAFAVFLFVGKRSRSYNLSLR